MRYLHEQYHAGSWDESACQRRAQSLIAFTKHADAKQFRENVWTNISR